LSSAKAQWTGPAPRQAGRRGGGGQELLRRADLPVRFYLLSVPGLMSLIWTPTCSSADLLGFLLRYSDFARNGEVGAKACKDSSLIAKHTLAERIGLCIVVPYLEENGFKY